MAGNGRGSAPWHKALDKKVVWGKVSSVPKADLYGWSPIDGTPPEQAYLPLDLLYLDERYQRTDTLNRARKIAQEFHWTAFGQIIVARRPGGEYYVVDGGTRCVAARYRGISKVPCGIHDFESVSDEAWAFFQASTNRGSLSWFNRHRAKVTAEDPVAQGVEAMLEITGHVSRDNEHFQSVRFLGTLHKAYSRDKDRAESVWWLMAALFEKRQPISGVFKGLFYLALHHPDLKQEDSLLDSPFGKRLLHRGVDVVYADVLEYIKQSRKGGEKEYAKAIISAANRHLRRDVITPLQ